MSLTVKDYVITIITVIFVLLFVYTGFAKLMDYTLFKEQVAESPILFSGAKYIALAIPVIEFVVAIMLVMPRLHQTGLYASFVLMLLFTGYVLAILLVNDKLPCSCGGIIQELSWNEHLIVNSILTILALTGVVFKRHLKRAKKFGSANTPLTSSLLKA